MTNSPEVPRKASIENLLDALSDDILETPPDEIRAEILEDGGDPTELIRQFREIATLALSAPEPMKLKWRALLGTGAEAVRGMFSKGFVTGDEIESLTGQKFLGFLSEVAKTRKRHSLSPNPLGFAPSENETVNFKNPIDQFAIDAPLSRFAETIRNIQGAVDALRASNQIASVIGVISSDQKEGKTTVAANLAHVLAVAGGRTLLIDCDTRSRGLTTRVAHSAGSGLLEAIAANGVLEANTVRGGNQNLDIMPCALPEHSLQGMESLASVAMKHLLKQARIRYDYVVLDIDRLGLIVDGGDMANLIDNFAMVVKWRKTDRKLVQDMIAMDSIRSKIVGVVLNRVDSRWLRTIESYREGNARQLDVPVTRQT